MLPNFIIYYLKLFWNLLCLFNFYFYFKLKHNGLRTVLESPLPGLPAQNAYKMAHAVGTQCPADLARVGHLEITMTILPPTKKKNNIQFLYSLTKLLVRSRVKNNKEEEEQK